MGGTGAGSSTGPDRLQLWRRRRRRQHRPEAVSYTHLDVYKRQAILGADVLHGGHKACGLGGDLVIDVLARLLRVRVPRGRQSLPKNIKLRMADR